MEEQEALQTGLVFNPIVMANDRDHVVREYVVLCSMSWVQTLYHTTIWA